MTEINNDTKLTPGCNYYLPRLKRFCKLNNHDGYQYCAKHIRHQRPLFEIEKPDDCPICCELFEDNANPLVCGHWIHMGCIVKSGNARCPICRTAIYLSVKERKLCNQYRQEYQVNDTYPTLALSRASVSDTFIEALLHTYPSNIRQFITEVGIDNIIDPHLYTVNPVMFQAILIEYVDNFSDLMMLTGEDLGSNPDLDSVETEPVEVVAVAVHS